MDKFKRVERDKGSDLKIIREQGNSFKRTNGKEQIRDVTRVNIDIDKKIGKDRAVDTKNLKVKDLTKPGTGYVMRDRGDTDKPTAVIKSNDFKNMKLNDPKCGMENKRDIEEINHMKEKNVKNFWNNINVNKTTDPKVLRKDVTIGRQLKKNRIESDLKNKSDENSNNIYTKKEFNSTENRDVRRPTIKTIKESNDETKIYKAVTFNDEKKKSLTPLQIKIPINTGTKRTKTLKLGDKKVKSVNSGTIFKDIPLLNRKSRTTNRAKRVVELSPVSLKCDEDSQQTEVAKWTPNVEKHVKQYYEAWVNNLLPAVSNNTKNKPVSNKKSLLENLQAVVERKHSPILIYEKYTDERYTGKIKVNRK